jgi:type IV pilus assembly protein PilQ
MYRIKDIKRRINARKHTFIWCLILIVMATMAAAGVAQEAATDSSLSKSVEQAIADINDVNNVKVAMKTDADAGENPATDISADTTLRSVIFNKGASIKDALKFLAAKYHKNIVPSSKVDGAINVTNIEDVLTLHNVTFEEAMEAILGYSFKYDQDGDFVRVYTAEEYKTVKEDKWRMTHKVFTLYYINAAEAAKLIIPVLSGKGTVSCSTPSEKDISSSNASSGSGSSISSKGGGDTMALNDTIVIYDYPENIEKAADVIKALDIRPKQVLIEATILSATLTEGMNLGVDLNLLGGTALTGSTGTLAQVGATSTTQTVGTQTPIKQIGSGSIVGTTVESAGFATTAMNGLRIGVKSGDIVAFITALESVTDVTILANPKILAVNKQEGSVQIGKTLGYRGSNSVGQGGIVTQGTVEFLATGTVLVFRPYIGNDGYIRMDIYPQDSTAQLNVDKVPDKTTAELKTNVLVKDGETIVIGGLFRDVVTTTRNQIPLLGDIPFIGALFRSTSDKSERQEVIVLLTPHIIDAANQSNGLARAEDISRKRFGAKDNLQWTGRARLAEDRYAKAVEYYQAGNKNKAMKELNAALTLRPTYLEALRLKEKIVGETKPDGTAKLERNLISATEQKDSENWTRR